MNETKTLGQRLYECREKTGMKQADVARALNVQRQQISYYENDSRQPDLDRLKELSRLYGVSTDYLLGMTDVSSSDLEIKEVCNYTGLSENAVNILHKHSTVSKEIGNDLERIVLYNKELVDPELLRAVNLIIENATNITFYRDFLNYIYSDTIRFHAGNYEKGNEENSSVVSIENLQVDKYGQTYIPSKEQLEAVALMILQSKLKTLKGIIRSGANEESIIRSVGNRCSR